MRNDISKIHVNPFQCFFHSIISYTKSSIKSCKTILYSQHTSSLTLPVTVSKNHQLSEESPLYVRKKNLSGGREVTERHFFPLQNINSDTTLLYEKIYSGLGKTSCLTQVNWAKKISLGNYWRDGNIQGNLFWSKRWRRDHSFGSCCGRTKFRRWENFAGKLAET